jgi:hypothetical protein
MNELDEVWSEMLASAIANAEASGRHDVAEYLALKASNDAIRQTSVKWLLDSAIELATEASRRNPTITMEKESPHNFRFAGANLVGSLLRVRQGVRCLTVEAGWTRTPKDGFMRGGALAFARISHFGMPESNTRLMLTRYEDAPQWFAMPDEDNRVSFGSEDLIGHFRIFLSH